MRKFIKVFVFLLFIISVGVVPAFANGGWHPGRGGHGGWHRGGGGGGGGCGAPEIDPSVASSAITLLGCGVLILTDRFRRKQDQE